MKAILILQRKHDQGHIGHCRVLKKEGGGGWNLAKAVKSCKRYVLGEWGCHIHVCYVTS